MVQVSAEGATADVKFMRQLGDDEERAGQLSLLPHVERAKYRPVESLVEVLA